MIRSKVVQRFGLNTILSQHLLKRRCLATKSVVEDIIFDDFTVKNEPVYAYLKGSKERRVLESSLQQYMKGTIEVPIIIGDKEYKTDKVMYQGMPHEHGHKIAKYYHATPELVQKGIDTAVEAQKEWEKVPFKTKSDMWLKAADLMAGSWRQRLNATTMLGQSKTVVQADIDSAAELVDFFRYNAFFAKELLKYAPVSETPDAFKNHMRYRGLEGFVAAVSPFNFTAIGGNLAYTPALMGCGVVWKPSDTALLSNYVIYQIMREAGIPAGVVNFIPTDGPVFGDVITKSPHFAGLNFTGSVPTFNHLWKKVGENLPTYRNFPRLVGECGGKNFHFIHPSADVHSVINATIRGAFEYCGQKCSATSRMFVPESLWSQLKSGLIENMKQIEMGPVTDFTVFMGAVIDEKSYNRISGYINHAKQNQKILFGGGFDKKRGFFIEPTLVECKDPKDKLMTEEIFGPVLSAYVYPDNQVNQTLALIDQSTPYALTGAIFAQDEAFLEEAIELLKYSTGNFYINDRSTGSVVGQQPFGGARMSGTNDKAGGPHYVLKWTSPQVIKETFIRSTEWRYSYMDSGENSSN